MWGFIWRQGSSLKKKKTPPHLKIAAIGDEDSPKIVSVHGN